MTTGDGSAAMGREVSFATHDDVVLRGRLYLPAASGAVPGIVMSHGFSATIGMGLAGHAEALVAAGYAVLLYDHRALGGSDGAPRQLVDPLVQTRDMMAAVGWLGERPQIDPGWIGLWGTSYSGGEAVVLAALDPRVSAVATIVPAIGLSESAAAEPGDFEALARRVLHASIDPATAVGPRGVVPQSEGHAVALMPDPDTTDWMLREGAATSGLWRNEVLTPAWTAEAPIFDPTPALLHLQAPVLLIAGSRDRIVPSAAVRRAAAVAGEMAEFVELDGHHCTFYAGEPLRTAAALIVDFFRRRL